jgi:predicted phosphodiesterase
MNKSPQKWVVMNDTQIPFEDRAVLWDLVVPFVQELKPYGIVLNGDIVDNYEVSDFTKDPKLRSYGLRAERKGAARLMAAFKDIKRKVWIDGNHEDRYRRYSWGRVPELVRAEIMPTFASAFRLKEHGFDWHPYGGHIMLGKLMVTHGFIVAQQSAYSAQRHFQRLGSSVLIGHTHRGGVHFKTNASGAHVAYENFCLCRLDGLGYAQFPDWQQGFSVVDVFENGLFNVQQVPILRRRQFMYGGQIVRRAPRRAA